jgi:ligand-binding SRPBCC domain-containing protein
VKIYRIERETFLSRPRPEVFELFADAGNLEELTPPWLSFEVVTPRPIEMAVGRFIDYRLKVRGVPVRWRSVISVWEPPVRFVDEQVRGPYRRWHHEHLFEERDGGTAVVDRVDISDGPQYPIEVTHADSTFASEGKGQVNEHDCHCRRPGGQSQRLREDGVVDR